jgi:hypothetical protein
VPPRPGRLLRAACQLPVVRQPPQGPRRGPHSRRSGRLDHPETRTSRRPRCCRWTCRAASTPPRAIRPASTFGPDAYACPPEDRSRGECCRLAPAGRPGSRWRPNERPASPSIRARSAPSSRSLCEGRTSIGLRMAVVPFGDHRASRRSRSRVPAGDLPAAGGGARPARSRDPGLGARWHPQPDPGVPIQ